MIGGRSPLVADRWRPLAFAGAVAGAVVVAGLGLAVHGHRSTHVDSVVLRWLHTRVTGFAARAALDASTPLVSIVLLVLVLAVALRARSYRLAAVAVVAPALASGLTEFVLKPWVGRPYGGGRSAQVLISLAYPSGHESLVASTAFVLLLVVCRLRLAWRTPGMLVLTAWALFAGVGLVVNFWHYATDVIGAIGLSAAVVLGTALVADRVSSPGVRARPRTTHGV